MLLEFNLAFVKLYSNHKFTQTVRFLQWRTTSGACGKPMCMLHNSHSVNKDSCKPLSPHRILKHAREKTLFRTTLQIFPAITAGSEDNFYRRLKDILDLQWLYKETKQYYGTEGRQSIDPVVFFKLILIGYLENLGSDRRIINTVSMRLDMLYFTGYDIDEALPWFSTLSRTRKLYGEQLFKQLFKQVLKQCIDKGMVAGKRQAMDSAPVKANASMDSLKEKTVLDDGDDYTNELKDDDDQQGSDQNIVSADRKKSVEQHHNWKAKAYKDAPGANDDRSKFVSNYTHYSTTDADARISVKPGKPRLLNYLAQVSVDTAHHVITQIQSDYANKKDSQCPAFFITTYNRESARRPSSNRRSIGRRRL